MAISKEDKHDVKTHLGKALANKVEDATRDHSGKLRKGGLPKASRHFADLPMHKRGKDDTKRIGRGFREFGEGKYRSMKPFGGEGKTTDFASFKKDTEFDSFKKDHHKGYSIHPSNSKYK